MRKPYLLGIAGLLVTVLLFIFSKTALPVKPVQSAAKPGATPAFNIEQHMQAEKGHLNPAQNLYVAELEQTVKRGDVHAQQIKAYNSLAQFWKDSIGEFEPYGYYLSEAAKLENSEKSLTFAAQNFLENLRSEQDPSRLAWKTATAVELFEKVLAINQKSTDARIGIGSAYIFGNSRGNDPQQVMQGIQHLLSVVREDSTNMRAQMMLGIGGAVSGQYDKAIPRLLKVVQAQPSNIEAIAFLADAYAANGQKSEAIKWYEHSKQMMKDKHYNAEVDKRIKELQGQ